MIVFGLGRKTDPNLRLLRLKLAVANAFGKSDQTRTIFNRYWRAAGLSGYYGKASARFELWFLREHFEIVERLKDLNPQWRFDRCVEFGCGDGRVLATLHDHLDEIDYFLGVDINAEVIKHDRKNWSSHKKMEFLEADFVEEIQEIRRPRSLYFVYGGVFEYIPENALRNFFSDLKQDGSVLALVEPLGTDHDLQNQPGSLIYGPESTFSHNHRETLEQAGWVVRDSYESKVAGIRWISVIATA